MIPDERLSDPTFASTFRGPRKGRVDLLTDHEWGGVALNNPALGLMYQEWWCVYACGNVIVGSDTQPALVMREVEDVTEISFCFDQNMNFNLVYVQNGQAYLWWYDTTISGMTLTELAADVESPRLSLDDKRVLASAYNDIILAYIRDGALYYRQQRDRFEIEYPLAASVVGPLVKLGMSDARRLQFEFWWENEHDDYI